MIFRRSTNKQPFGLRPTCIYFLCIAWILSGCSSQPKDLSSTPVAQTIPTTQVITANYSVTELLGLAEQSASPKMEQYLLEAASRLIEQDKITEAQSLSDRIIPESIPDQLQIRYRLMLTRLALAQLDPTLALFQLNELERQLYSNIQLTEQIQLAQLRSKAYELQQQYLSSARELIFVEPLIQGSGGEPYQQNNQAIWRALMNTSLTQLQVEHSQEQDLETKSWLGLAVVSKNLDLGVDQQAVQLTNWRTKHPHHPLINQLPKEVSVLTEIKQSPIKKIALLLPLKQSLGGAGKAVLNGFMRTMYGNLKQGGPQPQIRIYDTSDTSHIATLYWQAIDDGAELIIGPLKQENVEQLADIELPVPVLSLNYIRDSSYRSEKLLQFGLASEDSARMAAHQATLANKTKAIVIYPEGDWGQRNATAFAEEFTELGGEIVSQQAFANPKQYANIIQKTLQVRDSKNRIRQVGRLLSKPATSKTRRRQDTDLIFLVALAKQGRQIKPLLNYYYADDLPVYSISNIYSGEPNKAKDSDLDGIIFNETPWLEEHYSPSKSQIKKQWPSSFSQYPRLYALGADAFRIYPRLKQLALLPKNGMYAYTGRLSLTESGKIERQLKPVFFKNGKITTLPPLASPALNAR